MVQAAPITFNVDTKPHDNFVLFNGNYLLSFMSKAASGSPTLSVSVRRTGSTDVNYTYAPTLSGSWTQETNTQSLSETTTSSNLGGLQVTFTMSGTGVQYLDNAFLGTYHQYYFFQHDSVSRRISQHSSSP